MVKKVSQRAQIPPFQVMEFSARATAKEQQGEEVFHMDMGQPGFAAPQKVLDAAHAALDNNRIGYGISQGNIELRQKISGYYKKLHNTDISPDDIFITTGSSGAFLLAFLCAFDVGDSIALALPGYPCYMQIPALLGLNTVLLPAEVEDKFQPSVPLLEAALEKQKIDGLIIASPANPSGYMIPEDQLKEVVDFCKAQDIRIIFDEIYQGILYDAAETKICMRTLDDSAIIMNSFSKYFCMSGWRLGWTVAPADLNRAFLTAAQNLYISPPVISQLAAVAAFDCDDDLQTNINHYAINRQRLLEELPALGFRNILDTDGGFFIYAELPESAKDSAEFCNDILDNCGVAIIPGVDFDPIRGKRTVRFSFADKPEVTEGAITKLKIYKQSGGF